MIKSYKDLQVWQKGMELAEEIYRLAKLLPNEELYVMSDQMRRAAVSIPSNIAEGYQRSSDKDFQRYLYIAKGSNAELETQLMLSIRLNYISEEEARKALELTERVAKMLNAFIAKLAGLR